MLFALASALLFSGIAFYLYTSLAKELAARNEEHLTSMTELVRHVFDEVPSRDALVAEPALVTHLLVGHSDFRLVVYAADGRPIISSGTPLPDDAWTLLPEPQDNGITLALWRDTPQSGYRLAAARLSNDKPGLSGATILVALEVSQEVRVLESFRNSLFGAMAAALLVAAAIGYFIASRGLRPIVRIAESARRITASQLQDRLATEAVPEELAALAESFNTMLARLEDSFRRLSDFSADLAHELRTPLTNLLGRSQVVLSRARTIDEYREALESNVEEIEHLSKLVADMLFLAHADQAETALQYTDVDLRAEADHLVDFFSLPCEERSITIAVRGHAHVHADRTMVRRAIGNLLSNAIRHSPEGERIDVVIENDARTAAVSVLDRGSGVTPEHQTRIFGRFYRADPSRTRHSGGSGLGLAIVQSISRLHGGDVSITSAPGEATVFTIKFPVFKTAQAGPEPA